MDCVETRRLIERGVVPGARTVQSTALGFHLASCVACRSYRERHDTLLAMLLLDNPCEIPRPATPTRVVEQAQKRCAPLPLPMAPAVAAQKRSVGATRWWRSGLLLLLPIPLLLLIWLGGIVLRTQQNIAAMIVTPAPTEAEQPPGAGHSLLVVVPPLLVRAPATGVVATKTTQPTISRQATATLPMLAINQPVQSSTHWPTIQPLDPSATALPPTAEATVAASSDTITLLLLGSDRRPGESAAARTDAIMLLRIDPARGRVALFSLPRDLWVAIPGHGENRINAAYTIGESRKLKGGGVELARVTVSALIGVPIDYAVLVDFNGLIGAIDSIGGITVNVEKELYDARFPTMDYGYTVAHFLPGPTHMDGLTALTYSRIRHPDNDFARTRRQQAVLIGIGERLRERGDLQNLMAADQITAALRDYVRIDMPQERLVRFIWALRGLDAGQIERYRLTDRDVIFGVGSDRYALQLAPGALQKLVSQWYGP